MSVDSAHKSKWAIGEVVFGFPFLFSILLQFLFPFSLARGITRLALLPLGILLILTGISLIVLARREFAHFRQPTDPGQPTSRVIKTGVFSISRNPLYLGSVLVFLGIALMLNILWSIITLLVSMIVCHYVLIVPEERYLAARFGEEYKGYSSSVHRWIGRKRSIGS